MYRHQIGTPGAYFNCCTVNSALCNVQPCSKVKREMCRKKVKCSNSVKNVVLFRKYGIFHFFPICIMHGHTHINILPGTLKVQ